MIKTSPAEDPLKIRIGLTEPDLETLRSAVDMGINAGSMAVAGHAQRHDGAVLGALYSESTPADTDTDMHFLDLNVPTIQQIKLRLIYAMGERCIQSGMLMDQLPDDAPESILHMEFDAAERELKGAYVAQTGEPYPEIRPRVISYLEGGY